MADPRALALVLPALTPPQLARFMGPACQIGLIDEQGTARLITRPEGVEPSRGRITLSPEQYDRIRQRFDKQFRAQLVTEFAPRLPMERAAAEALVMVFAGEAHAVGSVVSIRAERPPSDIALALELAAALASGADNAIAEWTIDITPGD
jgi:hypothetical protein